MSKLFASILNSSVMLGNNLQQTTLADDIFRYIFFLGPLRVNTRCAYIFQTSTPGPLIENGVDPDELASDQQFGLGGLQNVCSNINFLLE